MKLSINSVVGLFAAIVTVSTQASEPHAGEELYKRLCIGCHVVDGEGKLAPPQFGMVNHVKKAHPDAEEFVEYIVNWVARPEASRALMPGAVKKFGLMPALPYDSSQVRQIAEYLYGMDKNMPGWYQKHYKAEHGEAAMDTSK